MDNEFEIQVDRFQVYITNEIKLCGSSFFGNEYQTRTTLINEFIPLLGYRLSPSECLTDQTAEKSKKKPDYIIMKDHSPIILIEAKAFKQKLYMQEWDQLRDYYNKYLNNGTIAVGILTDGDVYSFYSNVLGQGMDEEPFFTWQVTNEKEQAPYELLSALRKDMFDTAKVKQIAFDYLIARQIDEAITHALQPSDEFVEFIFGPIMRNKKLGKEQTTEVRTRICRGLEKWSREKPSLFAKPPEKIMSEAGTAYEEQKGTVTSEQPRTVETQEKGSIPRAEENSRFHIRKKGIDASMVPVQGGYQVIEGSQAVIEEKKSGRDSSIGRDRLRLITEGILMPSKDGRFLIFQRSYTFKKSSTASAVVTGRSSRGGTDWIDSNGRTLLESSSDLIKQSKGAKGRTE